MTTTAEPARSMVGARTPWLMLGLATVGFAINFWAWALLSPLGPLFPQRSGLEYLSEADIALLVAVPVIVGSLGRIVVGALTDRFGGRVMLPLISAVTCVPVLFLGFVALDSFWLILIGGFVLGVAGTSFAVGVPFVNHWFPHRRGLAIGIFGAGMGGTAISALTTVRLYTEYGDRVPFVAAALVLGGYAVLAWLLLRDAPGWSAPTEGLATRLGRVVRLPITWQASILYALAFGGYVAFSVYLPTYLESAYALDPEGASDRMAGFVVVAILMRPVGGWLSDRWDPIPVLAGGYGVVALGAAVTATHPPVDTVGAAAFLAMAAALGSGAGATFALIARVTEPSRVGGVTGVVGAAGGFGGFVPPLLMGLVYKLTDSYAIGLALLAVTALIVLALTVTSVRKTEAVSVGVS